MHELLPARDPRLEAIYTRVQRTTAWSWWAYLTPTGLRARRLGRERVDREAGHHLPGALDPDLEAFKAWRDSLADALHREARTAQLVAVRPRHGGVEGRSAPSPRRRGRPLPDWYRSGWQRTATSRTM